MTYALPFARRAYQPAFVELMRLCEAHQVLSQRDLAPLAPVLAAFSSFPQAHDHDGPCNERRPKRGLWQFWDAEASVHIAGADHGVVHAEQPFLAQAWPWGEGRSAITPRTGDIGELPVRLLGADRHVLCLSLGTMSMHTCRYSSNPSPACPIRNFFAFSTL